MRRRLVGAATGLLLVGACVTGGQPRATSPAPTTSAPATRTQATAPTPSHPDSAEVRYADLTCWSAPTSGSPGEIVLTDSTAALGLVDPLTGMHGHAGAFGDIDGDSLPDLVVGTFADRPDEAYRQRGASGASPDRLLVQRQVFASRSDLDADLGRTSGAAFADLDLDGDLDLVMSRNVRDGERQDLPTVVYANRSGTFTPAAVLEAPSGGRSVGVLDVDHDGLPDLFIAEDRWSGGSSHLYRNEGNLSFRDISAEAGLPGDVHGLGVAVGDLNGDRLADLVVGGSNRVFLGTASGLNEVDALSLAWPVYGPEDDVAGSALGDLNRDGTPDLVLGHHYGSTVDVGVSVPIRIYLTEVGPDAEVAFADVTEEAGLPGLHTKAPHVQIADIDNDGWPDIVASASAHGGTTPIVFRHLGLTDTGVPRFSTPADIDSVQYWVTAPVTDIDRDGRLDIVAVEWEPSLPSLAFLNGGTVGHWISISIGPELGGGIGTRVQVFESGESEHPIGTIDLSPTTGYSAGIELIAHFGLGSRTEADIVVTPPLPHQPFVLQGVPSDRHLRLPAGCP